MLFVFVFGLAFAVAQAATCGGLAFLIERKLQKAAHTAGISALTLLIFARGSG